MPRTFRRPPSVFGRRRQVTYTNSALELPLKGVEAQRNFLKTANLNFPMLYYPIIIRRHPRRYFESGSGDAIGSLSCIWGNGPITSPLSESQSPLRAPCCSVRLGSGMVEKGGPVFQPIRMIVDIPPFSTMPDPGRTERLGTSSPGVIQCGVASTTTHTKLPQPAVSSQAQENGTTCACWRLSR